MDWRKFHECLRKAFQSAGQASGRIERQRIFLHVGRSAAGQAVNERSAMQMSVVYSYKGILKALNKQDIRQFRLL